MIFDNIAIVYKQQVTISFLQFIQVLMIKIHQSVKIYCCDKNSDFWWIHRSAENLHVVKHLLLWWRFITVLKIHPGNEIHYAVKGYWLWLK